MMKPVRYSVLDPSGNITVLVESPAEPSDRIFIASELMKMCPEAEQAGFVSFSQSDDGPVRASLTMAGGEFCGNASMCAAALCMMRRSGRGGERAREPEAGSGKTAEVCLSVSGAEEPVTVRLSPEGTEGTPEGRTWKTAICMPPAAGIHEREFCCGELRGSLPVVELSGISHIMIEPESAFAALRQSRAEAEAAVREWCGLLGADGLGLMFLSPEPDGFLLTPLVYIPGCDTMFWENSCASGSAAAGMYLALKSGDAVNTTFAEPGGSLRVSSDPKKKETWLHGRVRLMYTGDAVIRTR